MSKKTINPLNQSLHVVIVVLAASIFAEFLSYLFLGELWDKFRMDIRMGGYAGIVTAVALTALWEEILPLEFVRSRNVILCALAWVFCQLVYLYAVLSVLLLDDVDYSQVVIGNIMSVIVAIAMLVGLRWTQFMRGYVRYKPNSEVAA